MHAIKRHMHTQIYIHTCMHSHKYFSRFKSNCICFLYLIYMSPYGYGMMWAAASNPFTSKSHDSCLHLCMSHFILIPLADKVK